MFKEIDIKNQLNLLSAKTRGGGDKLLSEAKRILTQDLYTEKNILKNLAGYNKSSQFADEEDVATELVYSLGEIKQICITYRLKFLDSKCFKAEFPYEAVLKIKGLNNRHYKDLKDFQILAPAESYDKKKFQGDALLFVKTNYDNYFLIHKWGTKMSWFRKFRYWHMQHFENLFVSIILITLMITLCLPINLITLDSHESYWSGYRAAAFFHLLIFNMGVAVYITFAFSKNFSSTIWNREQDFD